MTGVWIIGVLGLLLAAWLLTRRMAKQRKAKQFFEQVNRKIEKAMTIQADRLNKTTNLEYWEHMAQLEQQQLEDEKIVELQKMIKQQRKRQQVQ